MGTRIRALMRQEAGAAAALVAVLMLELCGMMALALDIGNLVATKGTLQNAADAGALSGARALLPYVGDPAAPNWNAGIAKAAETVGKNRLQNQPLTCQTPTAHYYNIVTKALQPTSITPTANDLPAIKVALAKTEGQNGGPLNLFFGGLFGRSYSNVAVQAVAAAQRPKYDWAVLMFGTGQVTMFDPNTIAYGNVGACRKVKLTSGIIKNNLYLNTGYVPNLGVTVEGRTIQDSEGDAVLSQAAAEANAKMAEFDALSRTMFIDNIINVKVINGTSGKNVVDINDLVLENSHLTLNAPSSASFVIRISQNFQAHNGYGIYLSGGVKPENVIFYVKNKSVNITHSGNIYGSIYSRTNIQIAPGTTYGRIVGLLNIDLSDGAKIMPSQNSSAQKIVLVN